jgi:hypothetical protein
MSRNRLKKLSFVLRWIRNVPRCARMHGAVAAGRGAQIGTPRDQHRFKPLLAKDSVLVPVQSCFAMGLQCLEIFVHQRRDVKKNYQEKLDIFLLIGQLSLESLNKRDHFVLNSKDWIEGSRGKQRKLNTMVAAEGKRGAHWGPRRCRATPGEIWLGLASSSIRFNWRKWDECQSLVLSLRKSFLECHTTSFLD